MDPSEFKQLISNYPVVLPSDYIDTAWNPPNECISEKTNNDSTTLKGSQENVTLEKPQNDNIEFYSYLRSWLSNACGEKEGSELCSQFYSELENRLRVANLEDFEKLAEFV